MSTCTALSSAMREKLTKATGASTTEQKFLLCVFSAQIGDSLPMLVRASSAAQWIRKHGYDTDSMTIMLTAVQERLFADSSSIMLVIQDGRHLECLLGNEEPTCLPGGSVPCTVSMLNVTEAERRTLEYLQGCSASAAG